MNPQENIDRVLAYLHAVETGDWDSLVTIVSSGMRQKEMPNLLKPAGDERNLEQMADDFGRVRQILRSQSYDVRTITADRQTVAVDVTWTGVLAVPIGKLQAGDTMVCHSAMFFEMHDGRIVSQRNFDCFEPF